MWLSRSSVNCRQVKAAQNIIDVLTSGPDAKKTDSLRVLADLSDDAKFAANFVNKNGLAILIQMIESGTR